MGPLLANDPCPDDRNIFLLVEDDADEAFFVEVEFKRTGAARLCLVKDGQQAISYLQGRPPYDDRTEYPLPDVILLDLKMPRLDGFEVLKWLRSQAHDDVGLTPVVVMSGSDSLQDIRRAYKLGANLYLAKPPDPKQLRERIKLLTLLFCEHASTVKSAAVKAEISPSATQSALAANV